MTTVRIVHLYPRELGINGDRGNVLALHQRLEWRGVAAEVLEVGPGEALPNDADIVVIGSGPQSALDAVNVDARRHAQALRDHLGAGGALLAVGAGMHVLAREHSDRDGAMREGVDVLPVTVAAASRRRVGEVLGLPDTAVGGEVATRFAGFVNHGVTLDVLDDATPLTQLDRGFGNDREAREGAPAAEGVRVGLAVGTHLHGPVLPMNPSLADELLSAALLRHGSSLPPADERIRHADDMARRSRAAIAARLGRSGVSV